MRDRISARCHPERIHKAKGLCRRCYDKRARRDQNRVKSKCHPTRAHAAKGYCKACYMKSYLSEYKRPETSLLRRRQYHWKRRLGFDFTDRDYQTLLKTQHGVCAICEMPPKPDRRFAVDHDHLTSVIRGLLCDYCNRRLIIPRNTYVVFVRAADYLMKTRTNKGCSAVAANTPAA